MKPIDKVLLRPDQVKELKEEKQRVEENLSDPFLRHKIRKPGDLVRRRDAITKTIAEQTAEKLNTEEHNTLFALEKELRAKWSEGMLSDETMRKNPPGAVDQHRRWETVNKATIRKWKNVVRQLEPDNDDTDLANIERYRPKGEANRLRTDAQISGHMSYGNVPQENWDDIFPTKPNSALAQVVEGHKKRRNLTPEQRDAARTRLAAARAKKAEKDAAAKAIA